MNGILSEESSSSGAMVTGAGAAGVRLRFRRALETALIFFFPCCCGQYVPSGASCRTCLVIQIFDPPLRDSIVLQLPRLVSVLPRLSRGSSLVLCKLHGRIGFNEAEWFVRPYSTALRVEVWIERGKDRDKRGRVPAIEPSQLEQHNGCAVPRRKMSERRHRWRSRSTD